MKTDGAIFDMDGLLFDSEAVYQRKWRDAARERNVSLPEAYTTEISGTSGQRTLDVIRKYFGGADDPQRIRLEVRRRVMEELMVHVPEKRGLHEILDFFRERKIPMAVASSSSMESIEHHLRVTGTREYFSRIVSGIQVGRGKPAPDIFLLAAEELGVPAERCLVCEDAVNGIRAAAAAGAMPVMIPDLVQPTDEIRALCYGVYDDLIAARDALKQKIG